MERNLTQSQALGRLAGVVLALSAALLYQPDVTTIFNTLAVPLLGAVGLQLALGNALVTAIAVCALATIHSDLSAHHWADRWVYPVVALISGGLALIFIWREFRRHIMSTREARWRTRNEANSSRE